MCGPLLVLHAHQNKNRASTTARQESCEQVFDNEAVVGDIISVSNDVTAGVISDVQVVSVDQGANTTPTINDATPTINNATPTNNNATPTNSDVAVSNDDITWVTKEQQYLDRITKLEKSIASLTATNSELLDKLTELSNKCQSYEDHMTSRDALYQERDQYRLERDDLQKRIDDLVAFNSMQNDNVAPPPSSDKQKLISHTDITVMILSLNHFICVCFIGANITITVNMITLIKLCLVETVPNCCVPNYWD